MGVILSLFEDAPKHMKDSGSLEPHLTSLCGPPGFVHTMERGLRTEEEGEEEWATLSFLQGSILTQAHTGQRQARRLTLLLLIHSGHRNQRT